MNEKLKAFIAKLQSKRKGKLAQWESEIFELREVVGATLKEIVEFLQTEGITTDTSEVHRFLHSKRRLQRLDKATNSTIAHGETSVSPPLPPVAQDSLKRDKSKKAPRTKQRSDKVVDAQTPGETPNSVRGNTLEGDEKKERPGVASRIISPARIRIRSHRMARVVSD